MEPTTSIPTHKHLILWIILFVLILAGALSIWLWFMNHPADSAMMNEYNNRLQETYPQNTDTTDTKADQDKAIEQDISASTDLDTEADLQSIDLEF